MSAPTKLFRIKQSDTAPVIIEFLRNADGTPITTIASVNFHLLAPDGTVKVNAPGTVLDAASAKVQYAWLAADTNTPGMFQREWECTLVGGRIVTVPNDQNYPVEITPQIA